MKKFTAYTLALFIMGLPACSQAGASDTVNRKQVEAIIHDYLMENPEVLRDAFMALEAKEEKAALAAVYDDIFKDKRDVVLGPDNAKVTIVEFFDYNCSFCKKSTDWVRTKMDEYPNDVRVIFKELPLLEGRTKTSRNAAKAALAAARQDKYADMHFALMAERSLTKERVDKLAEKIGLDMKTFKKDMEDPALSKQLEDAKILASQIPMFGGTPFFMINDKHLSGANTERLQQLFDEAMKS